MEHLVIIGASGHGKVCADIARLIGYRHIVFLDDDRNIHSCGEYEVIGTVSDLSKYTDIADFFVAIGNSRVRQKIMEEIDAVYGEIVTLVHPYAAIAKDTSIGKGTAVMAGAVINSGANIGKGCIVNTGSSVDHDCVVGRYSHISVGAHLAGTVEVREHVWVGIGAIVSNNLKIHDHVLIGAGAVVVKDIEEAGLYIGIPAKKRPWELE